MAQEGDRQVVQGLLDFALSDIEPAKEGDVSRKAPELRGLKLLPTASGTVGTFGEEFIMATPQQQLLLPKLQASPPPRPTPFARLAWRHLAPYF